MEKVFLTCNYKMNKKFKKKLLNWVLLIAKKITD